MTDRPYRGYLIRWSGLGQIWIEKDGFTILRYCQDVATAKRTIDSLLDPEPTAGKRTADRIDGYDRDDVGESPDY